MRSTTIPVSKKLFSFTWFTNSYLVELRRNVIPHLNWRLCSSVLVISLTTSLNLFKSVILERKNLHNWSIFTSHYNNNVLNLKQSLFINDPNLSSTINIFFPSILKYCVTRLLFSKYLLLHSEAPGFVTGQNSPPILHPRKRVEFSFWFFHNCKMPTLGWNE